MDEVLGVLGHHSLEEALLDKRVFHKCDNHLGHCLDLAAELRLNDHDVIDDTRFEVLAFFLLLYLD